MSENERKSMIKVRGGFSERIGKPTCITTVQLNEFDDHTRTQISNQLFKLLDYIFSNQDEYSVGMYQGPASNIDVMAKLIQKYGSTVLEQKESLLCATNSKAA